MNSVPGKPPSEPIGCQPTGAGQNAAPKAHGSAGPGKPDKHKVKIEPEDHSQGTRPKHQKKQELATQGAGHSTHQPSTVKAKEKGKVSVKREIDAAHVPQSLPAKTSAFVEPPKRRRRFKQPESPGDWVILGHVGAFTEIEDSIRTHKNP